MTLKNQNEWAVKDVHNQAINSVINLKMGKVPNTWNPMILKINNSKAKMIKKILLTMIKLKINSIIKSHLLTRNSKLKILLSPSSKLTSINNKLRKKKTQWLNIIANKMPYFNGWPIIPDKNGAILISHVL